MAQPPERPYDSERDTMEHIRQVEQNIEAVRRQLLIRARKHDLSKLEPPEKAAFDEFTPKIRSLTYGSPEYEAARAGMREALTHHYAHNRHHPEHFPNGIRGMNLVDLVEMFCDWVAAVSRHDDGNIFKSIEINQKRFGYGDEVAEILSNTAKDVFFFK